MQLQQGQMVSNQHSTVDLVILDQLIALAYWNDGNMPGRSMEITDLTLAAFPSLLESEGFLSQKSYQGMDILNHLTGVCDFQGALTFARRLLALEPADKGEDGFTWVGACLNRYSLRLEELTSLYGDEWLSLDDRQFALELSEIIEQIGPYRLGTYPHPFKSNTLMTALYKHDLDFFDKLVGDDPLPKLVLNDVFAPSRLGKPERQTQILQELLDLNEKKLLKDEDLTRAAPAFWKLIKAGLASVEPGRLGEVIHLAQRVGVEIFCIDRMKEVKANFKQKKFSDMILNQPWLALQARNEGMVFTGKDIRVSLKALEKASSLFERQWTGMVTLDQVNELKGVLEALLDETTADDFAKRKMSEGYVSVLSALMPYKGWMQKVSNQGRDNIFMADLGL